MNRLFNTVGLVFLSGFAGIGVLFLLQSLGLISVLVPGVSGWMGG